MNLTENQANTAIKALKLKDVSAKLVMEAATLMAAKLTKGTQYKLMAIGRAISHPQLVMPYCTPDLRSVVEVLAHLNFIKIVEVGETKMYKI